ncbi:hypothetical protein CS006_05845 [Bifidobacterium primatium]|uniref:Uncharacterized protein n=1 Tax=Bifidobacterium primatium TaxID=2045438 RepID=A0A2M9H9S6_9BIFI|nr:hypothetical protein CS006_05845 [Bifidobacterium primatium]
MLLHFVDRILDNLSGIQIQPTLIDLFQHHFSKRILYKSAVIHASKIFCCAPRCRKSANSCDNRRNFIILIISDLFYQEKFDIFRPLICFLKTTCVAYFLNMFIGKMILH